jgi:DNA-binding CsgD family transcriptional regulator
MLTGREHEILQLVAHGLRTRAIAVQLGIAEVTVITFIRTARVKLGARNRVHAAALAVDSPLENRRPAPDLGLEHRRLLGLLASGTTVEEAARRLHLSRRTAQRRLADVRRRLGAPTTAAAVASSVRLGYAEPELAGGSPDAVGVHDEKPDREGG